MKKFLTLLLMAELVRGQLIDLAESLSTSDITNNYGSDFSSVDISVLLDNTILSSMDTYII